MVHEFVFNGIAAVFMLLVTRVFLNGRDKVRTFLVVINLRRFQSHFIHPHFLGQLFHILDLVLIRFHDQELEYHMRRGGF
ncbi:hypothetical protein D3C87_1979870 [compost metagenome]